MEDEVEDEVARRADAGPRAVHRPAPLLPALQPLANTRGGVGADAAVPRALPLPLTAAMARPLTASSPAVAPGPPPAAVVPALAACAPEAARPAGGCEGGGAANCTAF